MRRIVSGLGIAVILALTPVIASAEAANTHNAPAASLGDSFMAGEGGTETGPYETGTDTEINQCHRSQSSPTQLLGRTNVVDITVNAACSGATTQDVLLTPRFNELPQVTKLNSKIKRTYIIVGGNDINFALLLGCFLEADCDTTPIPDTARAQLALLGPKLDQVYEAMSSAAPNAEHTAVLYPPLLPATPQAGASLDLSRCPELNQNEVKIGNELQSSLNALIAKHAAVHGFRVVDASRAFAGHDLCSEKPYFYRPDQPGIYHPNLPGRTVMAAYMAASN